MRQKHIMCAFIALFAASMFAATVQGAVFFACFNDGTIIDYCDHPYNSTYSHPDETCALDMGCERCMSIYYPELDCYVHGSFNQCNAIPRECSLLGDNETDFDQKPPVLTLINPGPENNSVFNSAAVLVQYSLNEKSDVYYVDLNDSRLRESRICNDCDAGDYTKSVRFKEGDNYIRFKSVDVRGNTAYNDTSFIIDSKAPRITRAEPARGFADGNFHIEFTELKPRNLTLTYGNSFRDEEVDLDDCVQTAVDKWVCDVHVDLSDFNGNDIQYWFTLTDIAGSSSKSKPIVLKVDTSAPIFNDVEYDVDGKNGLFFVDITEINFANLFYHDLNDAKSKPKSLCSKLVNGVCEKSIPFNDGYHIILLNATDAAGNDASEQVDPFYTDTKAPKFSSTAPVRGFSDGTFNAMLDEANPVSLYLNFGNGETGFRSSQLDIGNDCNPQTRGKSCGTHIDLDDYDGQSILYWFNVTDILGQTALSKKVNVSVDTTAPVINSLLHSIDGRSVTFTIAVTEQNLDSVDYSDNGASMKTLCTKLVGSICEKRVTFQPGHHDVSIQVTDKAGNAVAQVDSFNII